MSKTLPALLNQLTQLAKEDDQVVLSRRTIQALANEVRLIRIKNTRLAKTVIDMRGQLERVCAE